MRVEIKEVRRCRNGAFGNMTFRGARSVLITVSLERNGTVAEYAATVFHELMHLWVTILRSKGFRVTNVREHRFIYAAEEFVLAAAKKYMRRKK